MVTQPGIYWLTATQQGCSATDSIDIKFYPIQVLNLGKDTMLCEGTSLLLKATNANANYVWQDGSTGETFMVNKPGLYYVKTTNSNGCSISDSINVKYTALPYVTLGRDTLLCSGQTILLQPYVNIPVNYRWQDGSNFPSFNVKDTGVFTVTVNNICGTASTSVVVKKGICDLYIPNSFTPNNDNLNDVFKIKYPFAVKSFKMNIYNRYGQLIFLGTDILKGWGGRFGGLQQQAGVYIWNISFTDIDGKIKTLKGTVLLLR